MMDKEDRETFDSLPEEFMVYRGGEHEHMSWTLSKEKAEWFRDRYEGLRDCKLLKSVSRKMRCLLISMQEARRRLFSDLQS